MALNDSVKMKRHIANTVEKYRDGTHGSNP